MPDRSQQPPAGLQPMVMTLQIIVAAMAMGALLGTGVLYTLAEGEPNPGMISKIGLGMGLVSLVIAPWMFRLLTSQAKAPADLLPNFQVATIVSVAVLEGPVFLNAIAYLQERDPWSLAMAGLLWAALIMRFPTLQGTQNWIDRQQRRMRDDTAWEESL